MSNLKLDDNSSIYYHFIDGKPTKPVLIFLHEGLGCTAMWKRFPELLCRKTECPGLVYDRVGYGKSSPLLSDRTIHYLHEYALYELPKVIESLIPHRSFILVGHSDGGSIGLIFGAERSKHLRAIITEASHVFVEPETIRGIKQADDAYQRGKFEMLSIYHGDKTHETFKGWSETWLSNWFKYWNIEYLLPSVKCPLLAIQGCDDQYGTKKQVESIVSKTEGHAKSVFIESAGHAPHIEQEEIVLQAIASFVKQLT